ncbi:MAG: hypothetical protein NPIRA02_07600 [Nitrospirales bacterium]|nr:MAG: hypothetical protein NPIRA02_07600 [Nitrospirales bacterium]
MVIFSIVFVLMVLTVLAMAVGVLTGRNSLEGSCGGLKTIQGLECMACPTPCETQQYQERPCPHKPAKPVILRRVPGGDSSHA